MKQRTFLFFFLTCLLSAASLKAQIKIFTGGKTVVGSTSAPLFGATLQVAGPTFFSSATGTVTATSAAYIRALKIFSTDSTPDYTWYGEDLTGIFHPAANTVALTINRSEKFRFNSSGQILNGNTSSSASTPEYSWKSDPNTGIYRPGADILGFVANGSEKMRINSSGQVLNSNSTSSASTPDFSWNSDANTGIYRPANEVIGFVTNGSEKVRIDTDGKVMIGTTGSLNDKLTVVAASNQCTFRTTATHTADYGLAQYSWVNRALTKNWVVNYNSLDRFYVMGNGEVTAADYFFLSDGLLKENVETISSPLSKVQNLRGVTYNFKQETANANAMIGTVLPSEAPVKRFGLIAQEVEQVIPEVVRTADNGIKSVSYSSLIGLLIEAIKEQNQKITQLEDQLDKCCQKAGADVLNRTTGNPNAEINKPETSSWLAQNKPNPFNKETIIEYNVVQEGKASILVFDMNGKLLKIPGKGNITISGNDFRAGMYYYSLVVNDAEVDTKKMILTE
jgi:hypothetical protein